MTDHIDLPLRFATCVQAGSLPLWAESPEAMVHGHWQFGSTAGDLKNRHYSPGRTKRQEVDLYSSLAIFRSSRNWRSVRRSMAVATSSPSRP
jgi:hypothetical protein